jgi:hypothetical protein
MIERRALPHPSLPDVYTLGECVTESYPSDFGGPDTIRSLVVLYYGSFFRLSRLDEAFDWDTELWETLTHELQHHLESLAADDALVDMDYAADENYKRYQGEPFDPFFYRHGLPDDDWLRVEDEFFLERAAGTSPIRFERAGRSFSAVVPDEPFDVALLTITAGVPDPPGGLHLVVVRRPGVLEMLRRVFRSRAPLIIERDVTATPADPVDS